MEQPLAGLGKKERHQIGLLLKASLPVITSKLASKILKISPAQATQLLTIWAKKGWLSRVKHGVYIPVSLQSDSSNIMVDEPWILAMALFSPCYIGGWTACEHWGFTEQIFNSTMIFSVKKSHEREMFLKGARFTLKTITPVRMFGLKNIWMNEQKILISDPTKTIVDALNDPSVVGGIRMTLDIFSNYMNSEHKNLNLILTYGIQMKNTAIFKRLGFIIEEKYPEYSEYINKISQLIKSGYSQLDPSAPGQTLITKWKLWVHHSYKGLHNDKN